MTRRGTADGQVPSASFVEEGELVLGSGERLPRSVARSEGGSTFRLEHEGSKFGLGESLVLIVSEPWR